MRGLLLINMGIVILLACLFLVFVLPGRQQSEEPPDGVSQGVPDTGQQAVPADLRSESAAIPAAEEVTANVDVAVDSHGNTDQASGQSPDSRDTLKFPDWPRPRLALVVTGEQMGYFEPCGCTANQLGGMSRRGELFRQLSELGWTVRGIDAGSVSRRSARQAQIKFETMLTAMRELRYLAVGLGPEELRLDPGYLISQHATDSEDPFFFLSANLTFYGVPDLGTPLPSAIAEVDGFRIGITSVLGSTRRREVIPDRDEQAEGDADIQWLEPNPVLQEVMKRFYDEGVDFRILLSQSLADESRQLARDFPSFDLIVTAPSFGDGNRQPEMIGSVRMLQVGTQGKHAGLVGIYPDDQENPVRFELVTLSGSRFGSNPRMVELMERYQGQLRDQQVVLAEAPGIHPSGATYVGAATCGECHTTAYDIWKQTPHAHAFESLDPVHQRTGYERLEGVSRVYDPECLSCHVTGWDPQEYVRFRSGFLNTEYAQTDDEKLLQTLLAGNQCENCHGPGSRHIELVEAGNLAAARQEVRVTLEQSRQNGCMKCHDGENSPDFDFDRYWEEVKHYGTD